MYDNILTDFPRFEGEANDSPRIQRAINATENGILCIPKGEYRLKETIFIKNCCSLDMHPAAHFIAEAEMNFVFVCNCDKNYHALTLFNDDGSIYDNLGLFIKGGDIDGNGLASCLAITNAHHFTITNTVFHNGKKYGLYVGGNLEGHIYELICNNIYCKTTMKGLAGNIGIFSDRHDAHFTDCIIVDYTTGIKLRGSANRITRAHIWGGTIPPQDYSIEEWSDLYAERKKKLINGIYGENDREQYENEIPEMLVNSVTFDIDGACNVLDSCYADTAEIGYRISGDTRITNCDFFNNKLMGLKKSTVIKHISGNLSVVSCHFRGTAGNEILYDGSGENVEWIANCSTGGAGMKYPEKYMKNENRK